jgi:hypothetical protein
MYTAKEANNLSKIDQETKLKAWVKYIDSFIISSIERGLFKIEPIKISPSLHSSLFDHYSSLGYYVCQYIPSKLNIDFWVSWYDLN